LRSKRKLPIAESWRIFTSKTQRSRHRDARMFRDVSLFLRSFARAFGRGLSRSAGKPARKRIVATFVREAERGRKVSNSRAHAGFGSINYLTKPLPPPASVHLFLRLARSFRLLSTDVSSPEASTCFQPPRDPPCLPACLPFSFCAPTPPLARSV